MPGGLGFEQALYLIKGVVKSGRKIIAFDLNEVAPGNDDEWGRQCRRPSSLSPG